MSALVLVLVTAIAMAEPPAAPPAGGGALFDDGEAGPSTDPASRTPPVGQIPPEVLEVVADARGKPLPERITAISAALLGRPYLAYPLGEGEGHDPDPFARYDVFDCLTYVEEVLALSLAPDPAEAGRVRLSLRYGEAEPHYTTRRHFMELQWIPGNLASGWVRDTTSEYGPTVHLEKAVTAETWKWWGPRKGFAHTDDQLPTGTMALDVLALDDAVAAIDAIRPGTILLTVRQDRQGVPIWISHVGFVVRGEDGVPTMRHSTKLGSGGSRDHTLAYYLDHVRSYAPRKVLGIALLEPIDYGPR